MTCVSSGLFFGCSILTKKDQYFNRRRWYRSERMTPHKIQVHRKPISWFHASGTTLLHFFSLKSIFAPIFFSCVLRQLDGSWRGRPNLNLRRVIFRKLFDFWLIVMRGMNRIVYMNIRATTIIKTSLIILLRFIALNEWKIIVLQNFLRKHEKIKPDNTYFFVPLPSIFSLPIH